ncbi:oxidation resistance protein 1 [Ananas comosus]|uniref:Oxidation resistance protein 1 n=1 Tax=Ananas comosus TaxID=4615 RepID=A0A6P5F568_ANACO|nr:oxidation resistance protein 1 [Ananas comosus]
MGYFPSLGSKAAHFVSDITTVILNPISDDEPSNFPDEEEVTSAENEVPEEHTDGPDTSSFTAFLISLLSSSDTKSHPMENSSDQHHMEKGYSASTSAVKDNSGRKSLLARGKQSVGRLFHKAAKIGGLRQNQESKVDNNNIVNHSEQVGNVLGPEALKEPELEFNLPVMSEPSMLLSDNLRAALYASLPVLVQGRNWVLLYSTWRHGISLSTLYRRSMLCPGYSLLIVGDRKGAVFGGLVEVPLQPTNKKKYQGTNNCFVFTDRPSFPVIYRPTGSNHYFTLCSTDFLAFGGGGHFALYLDGDLINGSSSTSDTFDNPCLAHSQEFEVKEVELWGFVYASKYDEMVTMCRTEKPGIWRW